MKKLLFLLLACPVFAKAQTINTIYGPDNHLFSTGWQSSIAQDDSGNYYISQENDESVYKLSPSGVLTKIAGNGSYGFSGDGGPATSASLYEPMGVAVDHAGNVYIADMGNERIRKVNPSGIITTVAGISGIMPGIGGFSGDGGPATAAQLYQPAGVCVDAVGNLFIADADNGRIRKVDASTGIITTVAGGGTMPLGDGWPATSAQLNEPITVAFDAAGNMYICDGYGGNRIRKVNTAGIISTVAGTGVAGYNGDGIPATSAQLNIPRSAAVSSDGTIYIMVNNDARVRRVDAATGIITTVAGTGIAGFSGDGGPANAAQINSGNILVKANGDLVIADLGNKRIRTVSASVLSVNNEASRNAFTLCPNPAEHTVNISAAYDIEQVTITDIVGQVVSSQAGNGKEMKLDISQLVSGLYFARINSVEVRQFVKQ